MKHEQETTCTLNVDIHPDADSGTEARNVDDICIWINDSPICLDHFKNAEGDSVADIIREKFLEELAEMAQAERDAMDAYHKEANYA